MVFFDIKPFRIADKLILPAHHFNSIKEKAKPAKVALLAPVSSSGVPDIFSLGAEPCARSPTSSLRNKQVNFSGK